jgi:Fe2+ or Zn2+ uptake regulation protein
MAEAQTGASRATVQRNLDLMRHKGLIREITGQGRYRVWTAKI